LSIVGKWKNSRSYSVVASLSLDKKKVQKYSKKFPQLKLNFPHFSNKMNWIEFFEPVNFEKENQKRFFNVNDQQIFSTFFHLF
jgi:hypothetical protein